MGKSPDRQSGRRTLPAPTKAVVGDVSGGPAKPTLKTPVPPFRPLLPRPPTAPVKTSTGSAPAPNSKLVPPVTSRPVPVRLAVPARNQEYQTPPKLSIPARYQAVSSVELTAPPHALVASANVPVPPMRKGSDTDLPKMQPPLPADRPILPVLQPGPKPSTNPTRPVSINPVRPQLPTSVHLTVPPTAPVSASPVLNPPQTRTPISGKEMPVPAHSDWLEFLPVSAEPLRYSDL